MDHLGQKITKARFWRLEFRSQAIAFEVIKQADKFRFSNQKTLFFKDENHLFGTTNIVSKRSLATGFVSVPNFI
ncbi:hypothetical protein H5410_053099 [Solanum commersonii]|uniref:Uncharacterized protein n=1 Tax=Solanum commersonii TaxID=4109 RepID=A0A9J5X637_SOLCO|nr:hypothetical protein H5410_053099 [Solanum commersonii]